MSTSGEDRALLSRLKKAVGSADSQTVQRLVKGGVDVNQAFWYGSTLLMESVSVGSIKIVKSLIQAQADVNATNEDGRSALHIAARAGFYYIVETLLAAGAYVDARTLDGQTSLHLAVWRGHEDVVSQLLEAGAKVNVQSKDGWTPLRWAAKLNQLNIAKMLVKQGASINYKAKTHKKLSNGETPLYEALLQCHFEMARYLILEGADVNLGCQKSFPRLIALSKSFAVQGKNTLDMLIVAGYNIHKDNVFKTEPWPPKMGSEVDQCILQDWIQQTRDSVPSLMCLCRTRMRRRIAYCVQGRSIRKSLEGTQLPQILIDFLLFKGEIHDD